MKRWALVKNNVVDLITDQDSTPTVFTSENAFWVNVTGITVGPGWLYDGTKFIAPPEPDPIPAEG